MALWKDGDLDFLKQFRDKDRLISSNNIQIMEDTTLFVNEVEVEAPREIENIIDFLKEDSYLWSISKLFLEKKREGTWSRSGAAIVGVPFSKALEVMIEGKREGYSLFSLDDFTDEGLPTGSLCAYYEKRNNGIIFQLWEIVLPFDMPAYYIHGIYNIQSRFFSHFDGAMIDLDEPTKKKLLYSPHIPNKKSDYKKLFRLDGEISVDSALQLMNCYLPIEQLSIEYGIKEEILT